MSCARCVSGSFSVGLPDEEYRQAQVERRKPNHDTAFCVRHTATTCRMMRFPTRGREDHEREAGR